MNKNEKMNTNQEKKDVSWLELVIDLSELSQLDKEMVNRYASVFGKVTIASEASRPDHIDSAINWVRTHADQSRTQRWNELLNAAELNWMLFLNGDERIDIGHLPSESELADKLWAPALIQFTRDEKLYQFYQMRCVPATTGVEALFDGKELPDCTRYITQNEISVAMNPVFIESKVHPYEVLDTDDEMSVFNYSPQVYLVTGDRYLKDRKYVHSAAQYRQLPKTKKLLPFDRLAAVNGLASSLTEQYKWEQALVLADKSLESEPVQNIPYLIQFRIHQLNKHWKKAYEALRKYYEVQFYENIYLFSKANFEVAISREVTIMNLADLASKNGNLEQAFDYLEEIYEMKGGLVSEDTIKQLLVLSIEMADHDKSVLYFHKLFGDPVPKTLSESDNAELNDYMDMFMKNKWYDLVHSVYSRLYVAHPENDEYRRRLIVTLLKTNRIEQARDLATKVA